MSVTNVREAIERFLTDKKPQVLCIRGAWGTGKTYTWDHVLETVAQAKYKKIAFDNYAKVSLFGLNTLQEIKREVFQSTRPVSKIGKEFDPKDLKDLYNSGKSSNLLFKALSVWSENAMDAAIEVASLLARNQLICIDDLERKGADLRSVDVLGFISHLRDVRKCSVALLLNEEQLEDKDEFESYLEKVVDLYLRFEPSADEIAYIAIPKDENDTIADLVRANVMTLGITNVRVIRKILALVREIVPMLSKYSYKVTVNAAGTISLLGWSCFQPDYAPPLEYLKRMNVIAAKPENTEEDLKWRDLLIEYGWTELDEFDRLLLRGVQSGYFVQSEIDKHATHLHNTDARDSVVNELKSIREELYRTFTKPSGPFFDRFWDAFTRDIALISIVNMAELEKMFREVGDPRSKKIVDLYIETNKKVEGAFEISHLYSYGTEPSPELVARIEEAAKNQKPKLSADEILLSLRKRSFDDDILEQAAEVPVEEYLRVFKTYENLQFVEITAGLGQYLNVSGISSDTVTTLTKAGQALREIEKEGGFNATRARRLGIIQWLEKREAAEKPQDAGQ